MSKMIVPDEILESNNCRKCNKYLTIGPICIHSEGGNICGRCQGKKTSSILFECDYNLNEQEYNIPYALFGYINHLFPCVNRYEGCTELLKFDNIEKHEMQCTHMKKFLCGQCENFEGSGSQQIIHFKSKHPLNYYGDENNDSSFRIVLKATKFTNLVKMNNSLFFVEVLVSFNWKQIDFQVKPLKGFLENDYEFFAVLRNVYGEEINQRTVTRSEMDNIIHHRIDVNSEECGSKSSFCECLIKVKN